MGEEALEVSAAKLLLLASAIALASDPKGAFSAEEGDEAAVCEGLGCLSSLCSRGPALLLPGREPLLEEDDEDGRPLAELGRPLADLGRPLAEVGRPPLRPPPLLLLRLLLPGRMPPVAAEVGRAWPSEVPGRLDGPAKPRNLDAAKRASAEYLMNCKFQEIEEVRTGLPMKETLKEILKK